MKTFCFDAVGLTLLAGLLGHDGEVSRLRIPGVTYFTFNFGGEDLVATDEMLQGLVDQLSEIAGRKITVETVVLPKYGLQDTLVIPSDQHAAVRAALTGRSELADTVRALALSMQREAGWNPDWPFVPADLLNADFRDIVDRDPAVSLDEKQRIFAAGKSLGVVAAGERRLGDTDASASKGRKP